MAHWRDEYSAALAARDRREKANITIYDAYTKLADRTAHSTTSPTHQTPTQTPVPGTASPSPDPNKSPKSAQEQHSPQDILASTRADLIEAQRSRSELQNQLARASSDLEKQRKKNNQDARRMNALGSEVTQLQLRLKDREEELKGKAKLLDDFQDELASLNLQLNMAEERTQRLQKENQELVDRWMARMGKEAEAMNDASKFS